MADFLQLHLITSYGPACLNRDDTGRPKTAVIGGVERLRISSQSLKRAWRTSDVMQQALADHMGKRTKRIGEEIMNHLVGIEVPEAKALKVVREVAAVFGAVQNDGPRIKQLAFVSPEEYAAALAVAVRMAAGESVDLNTELILRRDDTAADIAMFGRMLADKPDYNREAAVQVAHAVTTHRVVTEDDFFTALDDLGAASDDEGAGAAHIGVREFGAGVFYTYICVDRGLLCSNLSGNAELAATTIAALVQAATTVSPSGHQASYASYAYASYVLAETGNQQPRSLVAAFTKPVTGQDQVAESIKRLNTFRSVLDAAYGQSWSAQAVLDASGEKPVGTLADVITLARG
jgi:CRISPR system Cascade subunit CasC